MACALIHCCKIAAHIIFDEPAMPMVSRKIMQMSERYRTELMGRKRNTIIRTSSNKKHLRDRGYLRVHAVPNRSVGG